MMNGFTMMNECIELDDDDQSHLIDMKMINQSFINQDEYRIENGGFMQRLILMAVHILYGLFWHPCSSNLYQNNRSQKWINSQVKNKVQFLDHLVSLKQKRDGFSKTQDDIKIRKLALENEMGVIERTLFKYRDEYKEKRALQESVHRLKSEICLSLSQYERCNKSYSLFNNVLDVIHKTLSEISMTEQLANLCGTVRQASSNSCEYSSMEDTLHKLVKDIARYEQTKSQIEGQLSLAKSRNVDMALHIGSDIDVSKTQMLAETFLQSGEISLELPQDMSSSDRYSDHMMSDPLV